MQVLGSFGDTVSHLPDCYSLYALVPDAEGSYPVIPNGRNPLALPGANSNPTTVRPPMKDPPIDFEEVMAGIRSIG